VRGQVTDSKEWCIPNPLQNRDRLVEESVVVVRVVGTMVPITVQVARWFQGYAAPRPAFESYCYLSGYSCLFLKTKAGTCRSLCGVAATCAATCIESIVAQ
jgi:hypothetical protein